MSKGNIRTEPQLHSSFQPSNYLWRAGFVVGTIVDIYLRREDYFKSISNSRNEGNDIKCIKFSDFYSASHNS